MNMTSSITRNKKVHEAIRESGFPYWMVAEKLGIAGGTLSVWLRNPLSEPVRAAVYKAIEELKEGDEECHGRVYNSRKN